MSRLYGHRLTSLSGGSGAGGVRNGGLVYQYTPVQFFAEVGIKKRDPSNGGRNRSSRVGVRRGKSYRQAVAYNRSLTGSSLPATRLPISRRWSSEDAEDATTLSLRSCTKLPSQSYISPGAVARSKRDGHRSSSSR